MIIETAIVKSVIGDQVSVQCESQSACNHCHASDNCGTGMVAKAFPHRTHRFTVTKTADVVAGDKIEIGLREKNLITSAMLVYLLPLAAILLSLGLGQYLSQVFQFEGEGLVILAAFVGGYIGFSCTRKLSVIFDQRFDFKPKMLGVVAQSEVIGQWRAD
ncbi:SoxR reducing system RseC family protein [Moritella sp.]|uniref:SoxR reducing system RseC family protein n=1 Tax=Moritella sp. TaxID=78556 RepID=UPI001D1C1F45|nr:SoxR reducing system RseC family protein [Moritella sp.]MCJ8350222.1 SoxR reducing system RseC family protein [Moritella sp.]NQZ40741.1 SoxR reducing system RseC family protein [Moritella sp.]NQZ49138.1 SoxR reducing system RseC family protein [Moritella sp.]